jgi:SAM-dependent methyltransferase
LDIGSKNRRYDHLFSNSNEIIAIDIIENKEYDIVKADARNMPFDDSFFNTVICFEVLEYIFETEIVLDEIARVLQPDGEFIFSVPFINPIHGFGKIDDENTDLIRLTSKSWHEILSNKFAEIKIISFGNKGSLIYSIIFSIIRRKKIIRIFFFPLLKIIHSLLINAIQKKIDYNYPMGYFIICKNE